MGTLRIRISVEQAEAAQKALAESAAREARLAAEQAAQVTPVIDPPAEMTSEEEVPVELVVQASRPHQDRWLVRFEGVTNRSEAEKLRGLVLSASPLEEPDCCH